MVEPGVGAVALAERVTGVPTVTTAPFVGEVIEIADTVTVTAAEVWVAPVESVTLAVNDAAPTAAGVHAIEYGGDVTGAPICVPFAKKITCVIDAPVLGVADAVIVDVAFNETVAPAAGAVIAMVGATPLTETDTAAEVACPPPVWVATAVRETMPALVGVQTTEYGMVVSTAIETPFAKNSTWVMVAPEVGVAVAVTVVAEPTDVELPLAGEVIATAGAGVATVTLVAADVTKMPAESVTLAVSATEPVAPGVHETVYGAVVTGPPMATPLAKNSTCVTLAPELGDAFADTFVASPRLTVEPAVGDEIATVGTDARAVTETADESVVLPLSSIASARSE